MVIGTSHIIHITYVKIDTCTAMVAIPLSDWEVKKMNYHFYLVPDFVGILQYPYQRNFFFEENHTPNIGKTKTLSITIIEWIVNLKL